MESAIFNRGQYILTRFKQVPSLRQVCRPSGAARLFRRYQWLTPLAKLFRPSGAIAGHANPENLPRTCQPLITSLADHGMTARYNSLDYTSLKPPADPMSLEAMTGR